MVVWRDKQKNQYDEENKKDKKYGFAFVVSFK